MDIIRLVRFFVFNLISLGVLVGLITLFQPPLPHSGLKTETQAGTSEALKIINWNVWMGTNGRGYLEMGDYETPTTRLERYAIQERTLLDLNPDILFLQELSPYLDRAKRLAQLLDMDYIARGDNAGIRLKGIGIPTNFEMGIAIFAKKHLELKHFPIEPPSLTEGSLPGHLWGFATDWGSFQLAERRVYLSGRITYKNTPIVLVNTHFHAKHSLESIQNYDRLKKWHQEGRLTSEETYALVQQLSKADRIRKKASQFLLEHLEPISTPIILAGDLNTEPTSSPLALFKQAGFLDLTEHLAPTWDGIHNSIIAHEIKTNPTLLKPMTPSETFLYSLDDRSRKIDYILSKNLTFKSTSKLILNHTVQGTMLSDHYGIELTLSQADSTQLSTEEAPSL